MRSLHSILLVPLVGPIILVGTAYATTIEPRSFEAQSIVVDDFIGTLNVEVIDASEVSVRMSGPEDKLADITVRLEGAQLVLRRGMGPTDLSRGLDLDGYPVVDLQVPAGTALTIDDMDGEATIGDLNAPIRVYVASLDATIGDVSSADIDRFGSGDITLGDVAGAIRATLSGSGNIRAASAGSADITKRGSGNVVLGPVSGVVDAQMRGSGDIRIAAAEAVNIRKRGTGDIELGEIRREFRYEGAGIGDIDVTSVDGPVTIDAANTGKIHIHGGSADPLRVSLAEYSDFTLDGVAVDPEITVSGASIIKLQAYVGEFKASGSGDVRVAGNRVYPLSRLTGTAETN